MTKHSNLKFDQFSFRDVPIGCSGANQLFEVFGSTIRSLRLFGVSVTTAQFSAMLIHLPMLEVLEISDLPKYVIKNVIFHDEKDRPQLQLRKLILHEEYAKPVYGRKFLADLFKSSGNLIQLHINSYFGSQRRIIDTLITEGTPSKLELLKLSSADEQVLELLDSHFKAFSLKTFSMGKIFYSLTEDCLAKFLHAHSDTWEVLKFSLNSYPSILQLPQMKKLHFLSIGTNFPKQTAEHLSFGVINWGNLFENLVTLHLYDTGSQFGSERQFNLDEMFPENAMPALNVRNLELPPEISLEVFSRIGKIFPNVLKLNLRKQRYDVLSELWITWPSLKTLAISIFEYE